MNENVSMVRYTIPDIFPFFLVKMVIFHINHCVLPRLYNSFAELAQVRIESNIYFSKDLNAYNSKIRAFSVLGES